MFKITRMNTRAALVIEKRVLKAGLEDLTNFDASVMEANIERIKETDADLNKMMEEDNVRVNNLLKNL